MLVRLLVGLSGSAGAWSAGELYETDEGTAGRFVAAGIAEPVVETLAPSVEPSPETAMLNGGPERAVRPRGRPRKT